ncbi:tripartite tricarboxylate transporter substrate binding protein [Pigmentiphaga sp.]|uniref:Bug family tripartite tricarboxylate transporter substrate binding protein n=1 Tax=Pigmentiphaga sp. TaxID=1977564 RepID=UPI00128E238B|nr:tripartite tricarboxylate transporter substrate binding protein [Pigmentiphaga sp.]MPS27458.1 tripartite tricarboxylate transporter substrate binding protein [Alcaligenaceae bacterium SAGV5]MPS50584.1 tripartite tricarboxylate transporter substrate binding protein [Alcaligenaceae bacterium SAGV3]MPT55656.1 tripartite tricarboxylate transporter substrate binding protein [Alcaligenaceae bacterium]
MHRYTRVLAGMFLATIVCHGGPARAQSAYPAKPIRIIVPYAAGGLADVFVRNVGQGLAARLGQPVIVENKPGANTLIGAEAAAHAPADGYTLLFCSMSTLALNVGTYKKLPYDPIKDFAPISLGFYSPLYLAINASVPAHSVKDLVRLARQRPAPFAYASTGNGGAMHVVTEQFARANGIQLIHVPYKGSGPGLNDLMAGQVQLMFDVGANSLEQAKAGRLRVLAVTGPNRTSGAPDVPTMAEAGMPDFDMTVWFGFVSPAGTPPAIVERLAREIGDLLKEPSFQQAARTGGYELSPNTPAQFRHLIEADIEKWVAMVKAAGVVPE